MGGHDLVQQLVGDGGVDPEDDGDVGAHPLLVSVVQGVGLLLLDGVDGAELGERGEHAVPPLGVVVGVEV